MPIMATGGRPAGQAAEIQVQDVELELGSGAALLQLGFQLLCIFTCKLDRRCHLARVYA